jgi:cytochrome c7-like protein
MMRSKRVVLGTVILLVIFLALGAAYLVFAAEPAPQQPILFSHRIHAEDKQIACVYCHQGVTYRATAGIPSVEKCMGCHRTVATDNPEVAKVAAYWNNKEPIIWERLSYLPDHVYFTHQQHIRAGFECRTCHGQINSSTGSFGRLQPGMSWCLDCHRHNNAPTDCWTCHK